MTRLTVAVECLYEDDVFFVLNKPAGMLIHRGWGQAETALVDYARERTARGAAHPIQRLDRGASGAVVFGKSAEAARVLSDLAEQGACGKRYLALVRGEVREPIDIDYPICRREDGPRVPARTLVEPLAVLATEPRHVTLISAQPLTGRLHQIRRHLKHVNHPLVGDVRYGNGDLNRAFRAGYGLLRLALHAYFWRVQLPDSQRAFEGTVALPEDLLNPLVTMGFECGENRLPQPGASL